MSSVIKVVASSMHAQQTRVEATAHNLANVNTPAYKSTRIEFQDREYEQRRIVADVPNGGDPLVVDAWVGRGVTASSRTMFGQGSPAFTGLNTDMAIVGDGFFPVKLPNGQLGYTRNGAFSTDAQGQLVSGDGYPLDPPVRTQPGASLRIGADGQVQLVGPKGEVLQDQAPIRLAVFVNPEGLQAVSKGIFLATAASGDPQFLAPGQGGAGQLAPGAIEQSNVSVAEELVNLLEAQRAYQISAKAVSAIIEMLEEANSLDRSA
jgi:flagellar basal-body rod protein FlgG